MEPIYIYIKKNKELVTPSLDVALRMRDPNTEIYCLQDNKKFKINV